MISAGAGNMQSPWNGGDEDVGQQQMLALGQIMERSTSAPPISSERTYFGRHNDQRDADSRGDFLFGASNSVNHNNMPLFGVASRESSAMENTNSNSLFSSSDHNHTGRQTTRQTPRQTPRQTAPNLYAGPSTSLSDALLSSGLSEGPSPQTSWGLMERSRSAAPQINPPPGMENHNTAYELDRTVLGERRSASAGVLGGDNETSSSVFASLGLDPESSHRSRIGSAVRPAPKTLMDLIQEDTPNDTPSSLAYNGNGLIRPSTAAPYLESREMGYFGRSKTASPTLPFNDLYESRIRGDHQRIDGAPGLIRPKAESVYSHQPEQEQIPKKALFQHEEIRQIDGRFHQQGGVGVNQRVERVQINHGGSQYELPQPKVGSSVAGPATQYITVPVSHVQRGPAMGNPRVRQEHVQIQQPHSVYASMAQPHVIPQSGQFDSQQVFFANGQPPRQVESSQQMHILPTGQTVYVNTPPYGYATVQYHTGAPPSQGQMVSSHHSHPEFVSVLPVQPNGQVAYWQHPEMQNVAQTVIMNPHAGPAVGIPRIGAPNMDPRPTSNKVRGADAASRSPKSRNNSSKRNSGTSANRREESRNKAASATSSPLLEEFRATKNRDWTMEDIEGHVVEFCQDQNGSRFIQQRLEIGIIKEQQVVMKEVLPAVRQLRNDVFGNYVVQKLLEFGAPQIKNDLRDTLEGEMLPLSLQMYGCRVVQKALEMLDEDDLPRLLVEFHQNVLSCIHDQNGNHVIQKCIEVMSTKSKQAAVVNDLERAKFFSEQIDFIISDVLQNVASLSCHPYGCRVLQRILEHCVEEEKIKALVEIRKCHKVLLDDQYGNYVIQHVLQYGRNSDRASICQIVVENGLLSLSKQKFASNVVEKLLKYGTPPQRNTLVREMLNVVVDPTAGASGSSSVVLLMVRDAYANYVVQTALDVVPEGQEKVLLLEELNAHATQLRNYTFAKHIVTKLNTFSAQAKENK
eukprot:CAMPEP_0202456796 /NCGR_PEP_ID=MMETSP1360-20130828/13967_1 /ASSEMBLY_ACC=CAM_ASM_000848 /TAXON_ID=515479 /ORGANISM="Licmophora paradoxa, Strain CCMP2313" /LENGTH=969 /DNA_ID=CAMNT_0049076711 /DNA_START=77 /DNA_END=2986 /DNA_ORIENTATION=+